MGDFPLSWHLKDRGIGSSRTPGVLDGEKMAPRLFKDGRLGYGSMSKDCLCLVEFSDERWQI